MRLDTVAIMDQDQLGDRAWGVSLAVIEAGGGISFAGVAPPPERQPIAASYQLSSRERQMTAKPMSYRVRRRKSGFNVADVAKVRAVTEARQTFGASSAAQLWVYLGLPIVPSMTSPPRQGDLFDRK